MATADYTPQPAHISPPTSITPTRHGSSQHAQNHYIIPATTQQPSHPSSHSSQQPHLFHPQPAVALPAAMTDFTSPSQYLNTDAYDNSPTTGYDSASSSLSMPYSATMAEEFYPDLYDYVDPSASASKTDDLSRLDDERTPVVSDQKPIPPQSYPAPSRDGQGSTRDRLDSQQQQQQQQQQQPPLLSPFRSMHGQTATPQGSMTMSMAHAMPYAHAQPSQVFYTQHGAPMPPGTILYAHGPEGMVPAYPQPQYVQMQPATAIGAHMYPQQGYYPVAPQQYDFGPPRSRNGSPTSSISSSAASLTRSTSTSSELRQPRPKVKLSFEDKRHIVELHRSNSSLRQEDIARQYGVDRSTISKIILASHRWMQPQEAPVAPVPRVAKSVGGRFPAIEARMDQWFDEQIAMGIEVRDSVARDQAKEFAKTMGFPMDRFKASAKWLDKFKDRRRQAGRAAPGSATYGFYPQYPQAPFANQSIMLSRSQSAVTLSSSDSSGGQDVYQPSPGNHSMMIPTPEVVTPHQMPLTRSETDLVHLDTTPSSRQRSQSSPQVLGEPGMQSPSSGKASRFVRPSPLNLQRQNSYHGSSPSPRRPTTLIRSTTSTSSGGTIRRSRPTSLAASAFGITPIIGEDHSFPGSPLHSPTSATTQSTGGHSRQHSDASLAPFTNSMGGMTISPTMSDNGMSVAVPPLTPITPGHGSAGAMFPSTDYGAVDVTNDFGQVSNHGSRPVQYATMPNKHYTSQSFGGGQTNEFGQVPQLQQQQQQTNGSAGWS